MSGLLSLSHSVALRKVNNQIGVNNMFTTVAHACHKPSKPISLGWYARELLCPSTAPLQEPLFSLTVKLKIQTSVLHTLPAFETPSKVSKVDALKSQMHNIKVECATSRKRERKKMLDMYEAIHQLYSVNNTALVAEPE